MQAFEWNQSEKNSTENQIKLSVCLRPLENSPKFGISHRYGVCLADSDCPRVMTSPLQTVSSALNWPRGQYHPLNMQSRWKPPMNHLYLPLSGCHASLRWWFGSSAMRWADSQVPKGIAVQMFDVPRGEPGSQPRWWCWNTCLPSKSAPSHVKGQQHMLPIQRPAHSLWALLFHSWMTSEQQENNLVTRWVAHRRRRRRSLKSYGFLSPYESDVRFTHVFAASLTLKQYVYNVLSAGSTQSAPVYGIFSHTAMFPEEACRTGFSDKLK